MIRQHILQRVLTVLFAVAVVAAAVIIYWTIVRERSAGPVLLIHAGSGGIERGEFTAGEEAAFRADLGAALRRGYAILDSGGTSLDAVEAAVVFLEDSPHFNAGKGAVFNHEGKNELDAAIMDGVTRDAGSVASVRRIRNPIRAARLVMEKSPHVMLVGEGADQFAEEQGLQPVEPEYFFTGRRWTQYQEKLEEEREEEAAVEDGGAHGTVGAVALDRHGNLAAATSTGGLTLKRYGRVGDSPIVGAGTFADNKSCAVSATGKGEFFIRGTIARDVCALVEFRGMPIRRAADLMIRRRLTGMGGEGAVIALDARGNWAISFNTKGMYRGAKAAGVEFVKMYGDE